MVWKASARYNLVFYISSQYIFALADFVWNIHQNERCITPEATDPGVEPSCVPSQQS